MTGSRDVSRVRSRIAGRDEAPLRLPPGDAELRTRRGFHGTNVEELARRERVTRGRRRVARERPEAREERLSGAHDGPPLSPGDA